MPTRSWMAALTLAATTLGAQAARADAPPVENKVTIGLQIMGLSTRECEVEVKPGHPGCEFPTVVRRIQVQPGTILRHDTSISVDLDPIVARSINPDRDCAFAITIREPGQPPKTYRRGMRLDVPAEGQAVPSRSMTCYLSSPSLLARDDKAPPRR